MNWGEGGGFGGDFVGLNPVTGGNLDSYMQNNLVEKEITLEITDENGNVTQQTFIVKPLTAEEAANGAQQIIEGQGMFDPLREDLKNFPEDLAKLTTPYGTYVLFRDAKTGVDYVIATASIIPELGAAFKLFRIGSFAYKAETKEALNLVNEAEKAYKLGNFAEANRLMDLAATKSAKTETTIVKDSSLTNKTPSNPSSQAGSGITKPNVDNGAESVLSGKKLNAQLVGQEIAGGHAFEKHVINQGEFKELGITTKEQFASHIEKVVTDYTSYKELSGGRTAYWDESTGTVVIRDPKSPDGGTAFRPVKGRDYFDNLR